MRKLVRLTKIDSIEPINGADRLEVARVGGWAIVVLKGEYQPGDVAVYFEYDSFLPEGNPAWQFLVDKSAREYGGVRGHVLRTIKLRKQVSQGLLLKPTLFGPEVQNAELGEDISQLVGVVKYEPPIPACLAGEVRGMFPSIIPKTDQERVQNIIPDVQDWARDGSYWEVTEKLEGSSCTMAQLEDGLHVCSRNLDLRETEGNTFWQIARALDIELRLARAFPGRQLALQGELVGPGVEGNIYKLTKHNIYVYDVYDVQAGRYLPPLERLDILRALNALPDGPDWDALTLVQKAELMRDSPVKHVPVLKVAQLPKDNALADLLERADGQSALYSTAREGVVFKAVAGGKSFKAISNKYLLAQ